VLHIYHIYTLSVEGRLLCIYEYNRACRVKDSWNFGWSVITLSSKKCIRCQGSLQIDGGCVVQDVKERIASRTYTKKKRFLNVCLGGGVTRVVAFFISVSGDVDVIFVRGVYMYNTS